MPEKQTFAYAKTKAQIGCAVTAKLISAFVFATQYEGGAKSLWTLLIKSKVLMQFI